MLIALHLNNLLGVHLVTIKFNFKNYYMNIV